MKANKKLSRGEISLLLYFETIAVDSSGIVADPRSMNGIDLKIARQWNEEGFISFKRYSYNDYANLKRLTYRIKLTDEAIDLAHQLRKERIRRNENK